VLDVSIVQEPTTKSRTCKVSWRRIMNHVRLLCMFNIRHLRKDLLRQSSDTGEVVGQFLFLNDQKVFGSDFNEAQSAKREHESRNAWTRRAYHF
jgi:hypothetical protein